MLESDRVATPTWELAARQFLRALRGKRSQIAFARRLGYRGNPIAGWESGRRAPAADHALAICVSVGMDLRAAFERFHPASAPPHCDAEQLALWLGRIRGTTTISELAQRSGYSRHQLSRWLGQLARPRLPEFFGLVHAITGRCSDLIAELVAIERVPCLSQEHARRRAARTLAREEPWTEAILRVLETREYRALPAHSNAFIARYLGIDRATERRCLDKLVRAGVIATEAGRYHAIGSLTVDTGSVAALKAHWTRVALQRVAQPAADDLFSYNVFSASATDLERIRELLRATYREIRALVSATATDERVALIQLQLLNWPGETAANVGDRQGNDR